MNNSSYCTYNQRILYQFKNATLTIPVRSMPHVEIQLLNTITWAPYQHKEEVGMNTYTVFNNDLSLISLINKARPDIHNPNRIVVDAANTNTTKQSRLGISSSVSSTNPRRIVFTRGLKNTG